MTDEIMQDIVTIQPDWKKLARDLAIIKSTARLSILDTLQKSREKLSFEDLAKKVKMNASNLAYHVAQLKKYGFITNELRAERDGKRFSFYSIAEKGKKYMDFINQNMA
ncbi:MAG: ArsR/SmtB family transcription factor [Candidatus Sigynarchaeota archaeon]